MSKQKIRKDAAAETESVQFSNAVRLTGWEWIVVGVFTIALVLFAPTLWKQFESFPLEADYRMPHDLSNDYWLFERWTGMAAGHFDTLLIGDSVIWGEYTNRQETLSHYLNEIGGRERVQCRQPLLSYRAVSRCPGLACRLRHRRHAGRRILWLERVLQGG